MPRRIEDIKVIDKRSIKKASRDVSDDVTLAENEQKINLRRIRVVPPTAPQPKRKKPPVKLGRSIWLVSVAVIVLVVVVSAYVASIYFSRATFTIVPFTVPVAVKDVTIVASGTSTAGYIKYEVKKLTLTASTTVAASDGVFISKKSSGSINVYNSYSDKPQRLIAGTRLADSTGKVYRLTSSVVIPGYTLSKNVSSSVTPSSSIIPGVISVTVTADSAGAEYNLSKNDSNTILKVVLYKGSPRYDSIYAKIRTDITGGFLGKTKTIDPKLQASTTEYLRQTLITKLKDLRGTALPENYVTFDNAYTTSFNSPVIGGQSPNSATITLTGNLYLIIFKKIDLLTKLAGQQKIASFGNASYSSTGLEMMKFTITNINNFSPQKSNALIAKLNGNIILTGIVPIDEIRSKLAGLGLSETRNILSSYGSVIDISKSSGELFPSWAGSVPRDQSRISIVIKEP